MNNAGLYTALKKKSFMEIPEDEWDRVMAVNVKGLFLCVQAVYPAMKEQGKGKIINISSGTILGGTPMFLHYVSSKAGVLGFTRALAREIGTDNICVNAIMPGLTISGDSQEGVTTPQQLEKPAQKPGRSSGTSTRTTWWAPSSSCPPTTATSSPASPSVWTAASICTDAGANVTRPLLRSRETGRVKTPTSRCERPIRHSRPLLRHSRGSGNPGVGCYSGVSPLHPAWIPAFAGMTISGVCASLEWRFDTAWKAGMTISGVIASLG